MNKSLQSKALDWCEAHAKYWSVFCHPQNNTPGFRVVWSEDYITNWIDDESQPPLLYRVAHRTPQALDLLKHLGIDEQECRFP